MRPLDYDIAIVSDLRFPGGTGTAIAAEIRAQAAAGYRTALVPVRGALLRVQHPVNPLIAEAIAAGRAELVDPAVPLAVRLCLVHHPQVFAGLPARGLPIRAEATLLIAHQPPLDGLGEPVYDWRTVAAHLAETLDAEFRWAPVGPEVRRQLESLGAGPALFHRDWHGVVDAADWAVDRSGGPAARPTIGRHSRPDPLKWPDDRAAILAAYPDDPAVDVRILGGGPYLRALVGPYPANWRVWDFNELEPRDFLAGIDFFVYHHSRRWVEAFGLAVVEAMASGAVPVLPPAFEELFGEAARYGPPEAVRGLVEALHGDPAAFREASARARETARQRFGPAIHAERVAALAGPPRQGPVVPGLRRLPRTILFVTSNGTGLGHLTRQLAVARRCGSSLQPVFLTLSQAAAVVEAQGFVADYLPFHTHLGCDVEAWNAVLRREIGEAIAFYDPATLVFDGNVPYAGLLAARADEADRWFVWCRRALWRPETGREHVARESAFDLVIEPRELAGVLDAGVTAAHRGRTRGVEPIRLLDDDDLLPAEAARHALGLDPARPVALLQLGSGNNFDMGEVLRLALARLAEAPDWQVAVAEWPIADAPIELPAGVARLRAYPLSAHLRAFDFTVSAAGYNSFHELIQWGIPSLFVPNENPVMDDQLARARYAERHGLGLLLRAREIYRLRSMLDRLLDPAERRAMAARCRRFRTANGAAEAAALIEELTYSLRADRAGGGPGR